MREILFRGKRVDNGEWVYGSFIPDLREVYFGDEIDGFIKPFGKNKKESLMVDVDRKTVGQFTGLCDKNGTKIFEGDIVQYELHGIRNRAVIKYGAPKEDSFCYGWYLDDNNGNTAFLLCKNWIKGYNCQVIGNIHDNPDLLK